MKKRLADKNASAFSDIFLLPEDLDEDTLTKAVEQLEDCVKNGLFYQAAELSDWMAFVAEDKLQTNRHLDRRLKIERLKRLGYLGFIEQEMLCRRKFCIENNLDETLVLSPSPEDDELRHHLYTAIGHTLRNSDNIDKFDCDLNVCNSLYDNLTANYERKDEISGVTFFLKKKQHSSISGTIDTLKVSFPKLTNDVNFVLLDNAIDWMW